MAAFVTGRHEVDPYKRTAFAQRTFVGPGSRRPENAPPSRADTRSAPTKDRSYRDFLMAPFHAEGEIHGAPYAHAIAEDASWLSLA
jgi:hypothetical protein